MPYTPDAWESDRVAFEQSIAPIRELLSEHITEWAGERCDEHEPDCFACRIWAAFDVVTENPFIGD